jgi:nucleoid-associated protein YgaU
VEVQYRAGDILLPASGTFVGDTGRSIFLEQNLEQKGQHRHFRWEIPYPCIVRLAEKPETVESAAQDRTLVSQPTAAETAQTADANQEQESEEEESAVNRLKAAVIFPRPQRSNI